MNTAAKLYILQQIDTRLDKHAQRLRELDAAVGEDSVVRAATEKFESAEADSRDARWAHQLIQDKIDTVTQKRAAGEKRLYGGTVTNPKELQDLQDEGIFLGHRIAALEERQLEAMIAQEDIESAEASALDELERVRTDWMQEQAALSDENDELVKETVRLKDEREVALITITAAVKQSYDAVRARKRGVAVALLKDNICAACGMAPSAARILKARSGSELVTCGNCARFIYVK